MFGFLRGPCGNRLYRQVYSGCCGVQHREYGVRPSLPLTAQLIGAATKEQAASIHLLMRTRCNNRFSYAVGIWRRQSGFAATCSENNRSPRAVLKATFDRACRVSTLRSRKKPSWGKARRAGWAVLRRGDCDCPVEACCEGCSAGGEGSGICCKVCECCDACGNCDCGNKRKSKNTTNQNQPIQVGTPAANVGSRGIAVGPLNPSGVVRINNVDYPAKTSGSWVANGEFVEVVAFDAFGLLVVPLRDIRDVQS